MQYSNDQNNEENQYIFNSIWETVLTNQSQFPNDLLVFVEKSNLIIGPYIPSDAVFFKVPNLFQKVIKQEIITDK